MQSESLNADLVQLLARHADWWRRKGTLYAEVSQGPLGDLWLPLADGSEAQTDLDLTPELLDLERLAGEPRTSGLLEVEGDRIATREPYVRVPWVEAILGCPVRATIQGGSMRTRHGLASWQDWRDGGLPLRQDWLESLLALTEKLVARSGGRYVVTQTLMRGPCDLAEALLGADALCLALYDHPRELCALLDWATTVFIEVWRAQIARIPPLVGGSVNTFGVWSPGTVVRTQCDASAFLSPQQYANWFLPYDVRISQAADHSLIHLHSGSLHTVRALLEVEHPRAIQVSLDPEPSGPPLEALLGAFRRILGSKPLIVDGSLSASQVRLLRDALPPDGLYILARVDRPAR